MYSKIISVSIAALVLGHASAFSPSALQRAVVVQRPAVCPRPAARRGVSLRMTQAPPDVDPVVLKELLDKAAERYADGMNPTDAIAVLRQGKTVDQALDLLDIAYQRRAAVGSKDGFFKSFVDVDGEYTDDGWVDETATQRQGSGLGAVLGGLFGGSKTVTRPGGKTREQLDAEMNVIEFVDGTKGDLITASRAGTAVPFGGLNPNQVEVYKNLERSPSGTTTKVKGKLQPSPKPEGSEKIERFIQFKENDPRGPPPPPPLPVGWYSAMDDATGKEYYYTAEGAVQWDFPAWK